MLVKSVRKLSQLNIDVNKDWDAKSITNIRQVAAGMDIGNLVQSNGTVLVRIATGPNGYVLTSQGPGKVLTWAPAGGSLKYYFPVVISSSNSESIVTVSDLVSKLALLETNHVQTYIDDPADLILRFDPTISSSHSEIALIGADESISKSGPLKAAMSILCDGFVEETATAVQTDHTAQARDATANDLNLNPMTDSVDDKIYVGSSYKFWQIQMQLGTQGVGNWTNVWEYWNGSSWTSVVNEWDGSNEWQASAGLVMISHTPQVDWSLTSIMGMNLYWLRSRTSNFVNRTTKPLGSQVWVAINV